MKKRNSSTQLIIWLLLTALTSAALASCAEQADDNSPSVTQADTAAVTDPEDLDSLEARQKVSDNLGEYDFEGAKLRAVVQTGSELDFWVEEAEGDPLEDAVFERNSKLSERFNVIIDEPLIIDYNQISSQVRKSVTADEDEYDLVFGQMETTGQDALNGLFMNWYDIPKLDFSRPWYPKSLIENAATVNGKMFSMVSDLCISYADQTWAIVFDKVYAANYNLPDVYEYVREGSWTIDRLAELTKDIYLDSNNNNRNDEDDFFGYVTGANGCLVLSYFYGFNQKLVEVTDDLYVEMVLNSEKTVNIVEKLNELFYKTQGIKSVGDSSNAGLYNKFLNGHTIFAPMQLQYTYEILRDYENDYGIVPMPKWDEAQEQYYSSVDAGSNVIAVPITATQLDLIGYMVESMSCESWKSVLPTFYDVALGTKSVRDEESIEMLDIILDNRSVDFASLYNAWNGWVFELPGFVSSGNFASKYKQLERAKIKHYDKIIDCFIDE